MCVFCFSSLPFVADEKRRLFPVGDIIFFKSMTPCYSFPRSFVVFFGKNLQGQSWTYIADKHESDVLEAVECFNDHQKVLAGIHESFLGVRFNDPTLAKVHM